MRAGENSCRRSFSMKTKRVNNGRVRGTPGNVVLIDLDDDIVVVIDDAPESSHANFGTSKLPGDREKSSVEAVIDIDDDDDDDTGVDIGISVEVDVDLVSDASSSKSQFPFKTMGSSVNRDTDECEFVSEKTTTFQFSKCNQTYCTKSRAKNRYGLDPAFDNDSVDSDSSDCEIMGDSYGKLREDWESASLKKKHVRNRRSFFEGHSSASESSNGARANFAEEKGKEQCPRSGKAECMKENQPEFFASDGGNVNTSSKTSSESFFMDVDKSSREKPESVLEKDSTGRNEDFRPGGGSSSGDPHYSNVDQANEGAFDGIFGNNNKEPFLQESFKAAAGTATEGFWNDKEPSAHGSPFRSFEQEVGDKQATPPSARSREKNNLDSGQAFVPNSRLFDKTLVNGAHLPDENFGGGSEDCCDGKSEGSYRKGCYQDNVRVDSEGAAIHNSTLDRPSSSVNESSFVGVKEPIGNIECAQDVNVTPVETCIITDREKLKDTEEFKRAAEEEWALRQRELRIQAEEAQKLRKRKKAEIMRLNDIERRQKQRVEEVRETQKKNAEDINLKEELRGEIRKEINKLEITCIDMASLLRGLGIPVNGGLSPMSQDVNAAYKCALLKFHPDRQSRMDIRQQVEAEEKFKLISRMKDKFLTSSCC